MVIEIVRAENDMDHSMISPWSHKLRFPPWALLNDYFFQQEEVQMLYILKLVYVPYIHLVQYSSIFRPAIYVHHTRRYNRKYPTNYIA